MSIGQEYASFISLRAFTQALEECGCDHLKKFEIKDPQSYRNAPSRSMRRGKGSSKGSGILEAVILLSLGMP